MSDKKADIKKQQYEKMTTSYKFIKFRGAPFVFDPDTTLYTPLTSDLFGTLFYAQHEHASITQIREVEHKIGLVAPTMDHLDHLIQFQNQTWNTKTLQFTTTKDSPILRSPVAPDSDTAPALRFLTELAKGDSDLANDILQAIAPLFMHKKPAGVIWFVGNGANGKSSLLDAIYRIIGHHLASMTVASIEDGRDTPRLQGVIGNICRESSETRVVDAEKYKAIGTHEPFEVHRFHAQAPVLIKTNFHTIFNANNVPIFSDKTEGSRRRTLIVPFPAKFPDNPNFENKTFTPEFLGGLITLILDATHQIRDNGYRYKFSPATIGAKHDYDSEVNTAEAFLAHLRKNKVKAFANYRILEMSYENWCSDNGFIPLGRTNLKRVMTSQALANRQSYRNPETQQVQNAYFIDKADPKAQLTSIPNGMLVGLDANLDPEIKFETMPPKAKQGELGPDW